MFSITRAPSAYAAVAIAIPLSYDENLVTRNVYRSPNLLIIPKFNSSGDRRTSVPSAQACQPSSNQRQTLLCTRPTLSPLKREARKEPLRPTPTLRTPQCRGTLRSGDSGGATQNRTVDLILIRDAL